MTSQSIIKPTYLCSGCHRMTKTVLFNDIFYYCCKCLEKTKHKQNHRLHNNRIHKITATHDLLVPITNVNYCTTNCAGGTIIKQEVITVYHWSAIVCIQDLKEETPQSRVARPLCHWVRRSGLA